MRLPILLSCVAGLCALAIATAALAGPMYLTSEPGAVVADDVNQADTGPLVIDQSNRPANAIQAVDDLATPVPEPMTLLLLGAGIAAVTLRRRANRTR